MAAAVDAPTTEIPADELEEGIEAFVLFERVGLAKSRGAARRLIEGGGAYVGERKVSDFSERITGDMAEEGKIVLRAGKKNYHLVVIV